MYQQCQESRVTHILTGYILAHCQAWCITYLAVLHQCSVMDMFNNENEHKWYRLPVHMSLSG